MVAKLSLASKGAPKPSLGTREFFDEFDHDIIGHVREDLLGRPHG